MSTLSQITRNRKIVHYAYYGDLSGTAELLNGSGYLFRKEGERQATLVNYRDPALMLLGHVPTADAQYQADGDILARIAGGRR